MGPSGGFVATRSGQRLSLKGRECQFTVYESSRWPVPLGALSLAPSDEGPVPRSKRTYAWRSVERLLSALAVVQLNVPECPRSVSSGRTSDDRERLFMAGTTRSLSALIAAVGQPRRSRRRTAVGLGLELTVAATSRPSHADGECELQTTEAVVQARQLNDRDRQDRTFRDGVRMAANERQRSVTEAPRRRAAAATAGSSGQWRWRS